jgi:steroid delta-isomerase-like uncharacterized protein
MTTTKITALIDRHSDAWSRRDPTALASNHAKDGAVISPMFGRVEGRAQIRESYAALFSVFPDWQMQFDPPLIDGNRVALSFTVSATQQGEFMGLSGTGRRCAFGGVSMFQLDSHTLIASERRVYDFTGLLAQIGVLRLRPA